MAENFVNLEHRAATARREYWQQQYRAALAAGDKDGATSAWRFVEEYDVFIASILAHAQTLPPPESPDSHS